MVQFKVIIVPYSHSGNLQSRQEPYNGQSALPQKESSSLRGLSSILTKLFVEQKMKYVVSNSET